eukprot:m.1285 g.1285  ORF g.1285 m.1285 type:complete len:152 (+) comp483_c0_seq1:256-711(+)
MATASTPSSSATAAQDSASAADQAVTDSREQASAAERQKVWGLQRRYGRPSGSNGSNDTGGQPQAHRRTATRKNTAGRSSNKVRGASGSDRQVNFFGTDHAQADTPTARQAKGRTAAVEPCSFCGWGGPPSGSTASCPVSKQATAPARELG